jgi:hypothetical protein
LSSNSYSSGDLEMGGGDSGGRANVFVCVCVRACLVSHRLCVTRHVLYFRRIYFFSLKRLIVIGGILMLTGLVGVIASSVVDTRPPIACPTLISPVRNFAQCS